MATKREEIDGGEVRFYGSVESVSEVAELESVTGLTLNFCSLTTLDGLASFPNLERIDLDRNETLTDVNTGQPLESVTELILANTGLETTEGLAAAFPTSAHST